MDGFGGVWDGEKKGSTKVEVIRSEGKGCDGARIYAPANTLAGTPSSARWAEGILLHTKERV